MIKRPHRPVIMSTRWSSSRDSLGHVLLAFKNPKLDLSKLNYSNKILVRLHQLLILTSTFYDIPLSLFMDYNLMVLLVNLGLKGSAGRNAWFAVTAIHGLCVAASFLIATIQRFGYHLGRIWAFQYRPRMLPIFLSSLSFSLASLRSLERIDVYSFLQRVRFASWNGTSDYCHVVQSRRDFVCQETYWLTQNWPMVLVHLPKGLIAVAVLLAFELGGMALQITSADRSYFDASGDLSTFSFAVLIANAAWCAWRLSVLLLATLLYVLADEDHEISYLWRGISARSTQPIDVEIAPLPPHTPEWVRRTEDRIRSLAMFCFVPPSSKEQKVGQVARNSQSVTAVPVRSPTAMSPSLAAEDGYKSVPVQVPLEALPATPTESASAQVPDGPFDCFRHSLDESSYGHDSLESDASLFPFLLVPASLTPAPMSTSADSYATDETTSLSVIDEVDEADAASTTRTHMSDRSSDTAKPIAFPKHRDVSNGSGDSPAETRRHSHNTFGRRHSSAASSARGVVI